MKKILLCGYFGFRNFGDEWLLKVLINLLKQFGKKENELNVLYNVKQKIKINDGLYYIPRWNFYEMFKNIKVSNTVIFCGGVFQDQTSILSFFYYFSILLASKLFRKNVVMLSTELIIEKLPKIIVRILLKNIDVLYLRNRIELDKFKKFSYKNLEFCPDICFFEKQNKKNSVNEIKTLGLVLKKTTNKKLLIEVCKKLSSNYKLVFIPFHLKEDYKFCLGIIEELNSCEVRVWDKVENYKEIFFDIDFVITSRLHGVVASINLDIPFVCISDGYKLKAFVYEIDNKRCISLNELENLELFLKKDFEFVENYKKIIEEKFKFLSQNSYI